jgi:hypothetical protein
MQASGPSFHQKSLPPGTNPLLTYEEREPMDIRTIGEAKTVAEPAPSMAGTTREIGTVPPRHRSSRPTARDLIADPFPQRVSA